MTLTQAVALEWEPIAGAILATLGFAVGLAFRLGFYRSAARWYFDESSPWYIRHLPFGLMPLGLMILLWIGGGVAIGRLPDWLIWFMVLVGAACGVLGFVISYSPPQTMKPQWLRIQEASRGQVRGPEKAGGVWQIVDMLALIILAGGCMVLIVISTLMIVLHLA